MRLAHLPEPEPNTNTVARLPWVVCIRLIAALSIALWAAVGLAIHAIYAAL